MFNSRTGSVITGAMKLPYPTFKTSWLVILLPLVVLYYAIGVIIVQRIDDSPNVNSSHYQVQGGSEAVAAAVTLIDREISKHWTPNDPLIYPGSMLVRMPAFQRGVMASIARFTIEMSDQMGRSRGSSQTDPDLQKAAGLLNYSPDVWMWDWSVSLFPTASSEKQYREGMQSLIRYNERLSKGQAVFEQRSDNLQQTLERMVSDLGSSSAAIDDHIQHRSAFALSASANLFYTTKGRMYGNYIILKAMQKDFAQVIAERQLQTVWEAMLASLAEGMEADHFLVMNADPKRSIFANHLASEGFYLLRARTQMREAINILLK